MTSSKRQLGGEDVADHEVTVSGKEYYRDGFASTTNTQWGYGTMNLYLSLDILRRL